MKTVEEAVKFLTGAIRDDKDLRRGYKANIAMQFVDAVKEKGIDFSQLNEIANEAAERFLNLWCKK